MARNLAFLIYLLLPLVASAAQPQARLITYTGRIAPLKVSDKEALTKGFHVTWFVPAVTNDGEEQSAAMFLVEENLHALPWFLRTGFASANGQNSPPIGYRLNGRPRLVELPVLSFSNLPAKSAENLSNVVSTKTIDGRRCRVFDGELPSGRNAQLAIDAETKQLIEYRAEVVIGRGDRLQLSLELEKEEPLSKDRAAKIAALADRLKTVLPKPGKLSDPFRYKLPAATIARIDADRDEWLAAARQSPYQDYVNDLLRAVDDRGMRQEAMGKLAKTIVGKSAPQLPTTQLDGTSIDSAILKNQLVILHFWNYDIEPLSKPFGQVGPLDFLARKYRDKDVEVMGIVVDPGFAKPLTSGPPLRSAKRFAEFMNLDYALCRDSGKLLKQYGNPRAHGAELPVWVVIDKKRKVRFYKTGLFQVENPTKGLQELEDTIKQLIKE